MGQNKLAVDDPDSLQMAEMYRLGLTLQAIGDVYGLTRERIRQRIVPFGIRRCDGGRFIAQQWQRAARAAKEEVRDAKYMKAFGLTYAKIVELRALGVPRIYRAQYHNALRRGIEWQFTLSDRWAVWVTSGRWTQRGRGKGRYVMSRLNDSGPYSSDNVRIILSTDNNSEFMQRALATGILPARTVRCEELNDLVDWAYLRESAGETT